MRCVWEERCNQLEVGLNALASMFLFLWIYTINFHKMSLEIL